VQRARSYSFFFKELFDDSLHNEILNYHAFMYLLSVLEFNAAFSDIVNYIENKYGKRPWFYHRYTFYSLKRFEDRVNDFNSFLNKIGFQFNILVSYENKTFVRSTLEKLRLARSLKAESQNHGDTESKRFT